MVVATMLNSVSASARSIIAEELKLDAVSAEDDIFNLGANSLNALNVILKLSDLYGMDLSPEMVFEFPVIGDLCRAISQSLGTAGPQRVQEPSSPHGQHRG